MAEEKKSLNFIEQITEEDLASGKHKEIHTRFPPEPNGYLHIGHSKSIILNFELAKKYNGKTNLRFDDTNPSKEEKEYVESISKDIEWLGYEWEGNIRFASDYFEQLYQWAQYIIKKGLAYVDDQTAEEITATRGMPKEPGKESPYRNRSVEENLDLFERMKNGEYKTGKKVLRAKIGMSSPNMNMRDPIMYRILHAEHHRTGNDWCIYPMYDFTHGQSDYLEQITHSICTLEFENHRPLYDWFLDQLHEEGKIRPRQIEFARLNLSFTVMSKRKLAELVENGTVTGWDDPRMPTISGLRRRGYTPESLKTFADKIGVAKRNNVIDIGLLEHSLRDDLNKKVNRVMTVVDPIKVVITNYPEGQKEEYLEAVNNPEDENAGTRMVPFSKELYIERGDFMEEPVKKFFRLSPGKEVRLRYAYFIKCTGVEKNASGEITEIHCTYDPASKGGKSPDGRKVKGTLHWVSKPHAVNVEIRQYDRLFEDPAPDGHKNRDFKDYLNPDSLSINKGAKAEPMVKESKEEDRLQFERKGYYCVDRESTKENIIFNKTVGLRDSWKKKVHEIRHRRKREEKERQRRLQSERAKRENEKKNKK
ncbi:MAG: glutamine--tRNA ligase/YqeY domain fusion protein [Bacteroidota bacterium]|nr:glutamine--tRNA ligase/YqeY domain fusion protein [Bacteroidota bacterium]